MIKNITQNKVIAKKHFFSGPFGLMFKKIKKDEACILVNKLNDKLNAGIHMFFVPQELDIIWADKNLKVVDVKHCKKWRLYWPKEKAYYIIELLDAKGTKVGDVLKLSPQL